MPLVAAAFLGRLTSIGKTLTRQRGGAYTELGLMLKHAGNSLTSGTGLASREPTRNDNPPFSRERAFRFGINGPSRFSRFVPAIMFQWAMGAGGRFVTRGQRAYERDLIERLRYHDGKPRRTWEQLSDVARWSWEKEPYPLPCAPENVGDN